MERVKIIPSNLMHAVFIAENVRDEDREEMWAATLQTPGRALRMGWLYSDQCLTGMIDGKPVCMWGVLGESFVTNHGTPWMVAAKGIDDNAMMFLRHCKGPVMDLLRGYDTLENYVDARNTRSITWLKWLGFTVEEPRPYGALNMPFHRFFMQREEKNV